MTELYCPYCDAAVAPEQLTEPPFASCTSCKLSVLAKRRRVPAAATSSAATAITHPAPAATTALVVPAVTAPAASTPALTRPAAWPLGFIVEETAPSAPLASMAGDPYRSGPRRLECSGLTITWHTKRPGARRIVLLFIALWWGLLTALVRAGDVEIWLGLHVVVGFAMLPVLFGAWMNQMHIHANSESLSRHAPSVARDVVLPIERIARLFTHKRTTRSRDTHGYYVDRVEYVLFARDHAGRDHEFVSVQTPEQASWLEERLEHHLGLVDRRVGGEHMLGPNLAASSRSP